MTAIPNKKPATPPVPVEGASLVNSVSAVPGFRSVVGGDRAASITISTHSDEGQFPVTIRLDPAKLTPPLTADHFGEVKMELPWSSWPTYVERLPNGLLEIRTTTATPSAWVQAPPHLQLTSPAGRNLVKLTPSLVTFDDTASAVAEIKGQRLAISRNQRAMGHRLEEFREQLANPALLVKHEQADLDELSARLTSLRSELGERGAEVERALTASSPTLKMNVVRHASGPGAGGFPSPSAAEADAALAALAANPTDWERALHCAEPLLFQDANGLGVQRLTSLTRDVTRLEAQVTKGAQELPGLMETRVARVKSMQAFLIADVQRANGQLTDIVDQLNALRASPITRQLPTTFAP